MKDELHTLSGAYVVNALPAEEEAVFERHLVGCAACRVEVKRLRETVAWLALLKAQPPPAGLRARVLAALAAIRPVPRPASRHRGSAADVAVWEAGGRPLPPAGPPAPARLGAAGGPGAVPGYPGTARNTSEPGEGQVIRPRRRRARALAGVAAVASAAAVALGVVAFDARRDLGELRARDQAVAAVLAAPDARTVRVRAPSGGTGTVVVSRARDRVVFTSSGLPRLPDSRVYELWLLGPDGARPAGLLDHGDDGTSTPVLAQALDGDERVGLTVEPAGGSRRPTTKPLLVADLPPA